MFKENKNGDNFFVISKKGWFELTIMDQFGGIEWTWFGNQNFYEVLI